MFLLLKLCLDAIVRNFGLFYMVSTITKDDNLQRNIEFLRRRYSTELAIELRSIELPTEFDWVKDVYLNFCLNKHLTYLECAWLENRLHFSCMEEIFCNLENLTEIILSKSRGDEILKNVAKFCPNIVDIDARYSDVSDNGIKYLCETKNGEVRCPKLKYVMIESSLVTEYGVELLIRKLPALEVTDYAKVARLLYYIHQENLIEFDELQTYNLIQIHLRESECRMWDFRSYTEVLKTCLTVCPKLKYLSCCISHENQLNLFANSHLRRLILECSVINGNININNFLKMSGYNLTHFQISDCSMSIAALGMHCPILKEFIAVSVVFTDDKYNLKPCFASLTECIFSNIEPSSNRGICLLLSSSPKLESISFTKCILSPEMKSQILMWCNNSCAKEIGFRFIRLETEFLRAILFSCISLKKMSVEDCYMDTDDAEEKIWNLGEMLPNKPKIELKNLRMELITEFSSFRL